MKDKELLKIINKLNKIKRNHLIHVSAISNDVDHVKIWKKDKLNLKEYQNITCSLYYMIKNNIGAYVAIVFDMGEQNLHWYTKPKFRGKKFISNSMSNIILNHLFKNMKRSIQYITIDNNLQEEYHTASTKLAKKLGFKKIEKNKYVLESYINNELSYFEDNIIIEEKRKLEIKNEIRYLNQHLRIIASELEYNFDSRETAFDLEEISKEIEKKINF